MDNEIIIKLTEVFCDVFDDESICITRETTADDIEDWDSLQHITLINAVESEFKMRFTMKQVASMQNVGDMIDIITG